MIMKTEQDKVGILIYEVSRELRKCWNFRLIYEIEDESNSNDHVP
jgi:hypothetical protein